MFGAEGDAAAKGRVRKTPVTRIPAGFAIDADMRQWGAAELPGFDIDAETKVFIDYWIGRGDKGAEKADWLATWRNWMRRSAKDQAGSASPRGGRAPRPGYQPFQNPTDPDAYKGTF